MTYIRRRGRDTWHSHPECSHVLRMAEAGSEMDIRSAKPRSGEWCNECLAKNRAAAKAKKARTRR